MLIRAEHSIIIRQTVAEVFASISDPTKERQWNPDVIKTERISEQSGGIGTAYRETHHVIFRQNNMTFEVMSYEPDHQFGTRSTSGGPEQTRLYILEEHPEGTQLTLKAAVQISALFSILAPLLRRFGHDEVVKSLPQLKQFLKNQSPNYLFPTSS